jgi:hypothetical protein
MERFLATCGSLTLTALIARAANNLTAHFHVDMLVAMWPASALMNAIDTNKPSISNQRIFSALSDDVDVRAMQMNLLRRSLMLTSTDGSSLHMRGRLCERG